MAVRQDELYVGFECESSFLPIIYSLTLQNPMLLKPLVLAAKIIMKLQINGSNFKLSSKRPSLIFRKSLKNGIKGEKETF